MASYHEISKLAGAPLEEVLLKVYPVAVFKWLYDLNLRNLAQTYPDALPQPERVRPAAADKTPKKAYLMALLLAVLGDKAIGRQFFETLPPPTRDVFTALTWERRVNLAALENSVGFQIALVNPDERRIFYEPFLLPPEHGFLVLQKNDQNYWSYYSEHNKPKKTDYSLLLPDAIRTIFKALVPPPPGYKLVPLDDIPASIGCRYSCAQEIITDLRLVAEYITQGHLKYTKSEQVAVPSLKFLHHLTGEREFFHQPKDGGLELLRTRLLVGGMAFAGAKERESLLAHPDSAEPVRGLFEKLLANVTFLREEFLGHLPQYRNRWCGYHPNSVKHLAAFFGKLPAGKWISWENMRSYHALRELVPSLFEPGTTGLEAYVARGSETAPANFDVREKDHFELVGEPLLKGFAFLLAAFGMAEIAYDLPKHPTFHRPKTKYLTPYDGLRFTRLTPLGEFVFRRRDTYEVNAGPPTRPTVMLDETRLLATCRNADPLTALALGQFMDPLATGHYQMTPKSFLGGCGSRADIEERIRLFRRVVSAAPPAIWERFFARILARIAPLDLEPDYVVLKVNADEEIRRLIASDPVLRELVLKVEGLRIAVRRGDLKKLAKRLEQFGYLSPISHLP